MPQLGWKMFQVSRKGALEGTELWLVAVASLTASGIVLVCAHVGCWTDGIHSLATFQDTF